MIVDIVLAVQPNFNSIIFGDVMVNVLVANSIVHTLGTQHVHLMTHRKHVYLLAMGITSLIVKMIVSIRMMPESLIYVVFATHVMMAQNMKHVLIGTPRVKGVPTPMLFVILLIAQRWFMKKAVV
jgi:hypothetical protein